MSHDQLKKLTPEKNGHENLLSLHKRRRSERDQECIDATEDDKKPASFVEQAQVFGKGDSDHRCHLFFDDM